MQLFPTGAEMYAGYVLLICYTGWNYSTIERMLLPTHRVSNAHDSHEILTVNLEKPRRGKSQRYITNSLPQLGRGSAGYALRQLMNLGRFARATSTAEALGLSKRVMVFWRRTSKMPIASRVAGEDAQKFLDIAGLIVDDHSALLRRLHRTHQALYERPIHNTQAVHDDQYLLHDRRYRKESQRVVEQALNDALDHAKATIAMAWYGNAPAPGDADPQVSDTIVSGCLDITKNPLQSDEPCTMSFLSCFACPNSFAAERHIGKLAYLHSALQALRGSLPANVWTVDWRTHWIRIDQFMEEHTTKQQRADGIAVLPAAERERIEMFLRKRLDVR